MSKIKIYKEDYIPTPRQQLWIDFSYHHFALMALWFIGILSLIMIAGVLLAPHGAEQQNNQAILVPPLWNDFGRAEYFLGTDDLGRDIYSRLILGSKYTFGVAVIIVLFSLGLGTLIGCMVASTKGIKSNILNHFLETFLAIPSLLMAILIVSMIGASFWSSCLAVGLTMVLQYVRVIYNTVRDEMHKEYITAAKLDGARQWQIIWYVIMPNLIDILIVQTTFCLSTAILDIAALGFLGLGAQPPSPEWGSMVAQGMDNLFLAPWTWTLPGIMILTVVLAINLIGDALREALKLKG
jgi:cationic peptide transport system permease protein